ncbi:MAG: methylthioribulose 1-phosphate dehydratase [Methylococcaceae bacterium]|jgi:methylthioribulose-1-phosphate dehydratase
MNTEFETRTLELIAAGRYIHSRGWVPATSGNFSARLTDGRIAITVSGKNKGELRPDDIMLVDSSGLSLDGRKPSAETALHTSLYRRYPDVAAVLHPHSPGATLVSRRGQDRLVLENYELLKALRGINTHEARVTVPIFPNDQDIQRLARVVDDYIDQEGDIHGYIIASHGFYTWGATVQDALRQVEALEFLFEIESRLHGVTPR